MAITKIGNIKECTGGNPAAHLWNAIRYILNPEKTKGGALTGGNCHWKDPYKTFIDTKNYFGKPGGRQGYHIILSFPPGEIEAERALSVIEEWAREYLGDEYDTVLAIHDDTDHTHGHIIFNSVSRITGKKYRYEKGDWKRYIQPITDRLCQKYGLSKLEYEDMNTLNQPYLSWKEEKEGKPTGYDLLRWDIDEAIRNADSYEGVLFYLKNTLHYQIKEGESEKFGAYLSLQKEGSKAVRTFRLGEEYSLEGIKQRLESREKVQEPQLFKRGKHHVDPTIRVSIPYERYRGGKNLSDFQREYLRKMYRARRLYSPGYENAWKYKKDILAIGSLQKQFSYLYEHGLKSREGVMEARSHYQANNSIQDEERRKIFRQYQKWKGGFKAWKRYKELAAMQEETVSQGRKAKIEWEMKQLQSSHDLKEISTRYEEYQGKLKEVRQRKQENYKNLRILEKILNQNTETANRMSLGKKRRRERNWTMQR